MKFALLTTSSALLWASASATPTPSMTCASSPNNAFGIPWSSSKTRVSQTGTGSSVAAAAAAALGMRGGELHEPETVAEVDALVLNAAANNQLVVIDFSATWCGPCKAIAPLFHELSEDMDNVVFVKVDVDENPETAAKYSVSAMPTFLFIKGGEVVDRLMGANAPRLQELIDEHM